MSNVSGRMVETSIADLERRCEVAIEEEQRKTNPDIHYIVIFCDCVRLIREFQDYRKLGEK